jgi:hypothetical protein
MARAAPEASGIAAQEIPALVTPPDGSCRNCGALARMNYCPVCGQETSVALPSARQFLREAAGRYVALDGRLWRTLAPLMFDPGFLTRAYLAGRRRRYIRPARLFLVLSLLMFAVLRAVVDVPRFVDGDGSANGVWRADLAEVRKEASEVRGPAIVMPGFALRLDDDANLVVEGEQGPFAAEIKRRLDRFNAMSREDKSEQLVLGVLRYGPYAMVALLPAFALLLKLLYAGRRRRHPSRPRLYAEHLAFAAHDLSFLFLIVTISAIVPWPALRTLLGFWALAYSVWAMKAVYGGSWLGVVARASLIGIAYFVLFVLVTVGLVLAAVFLR